MKSNRILPTLVILFLADIASSHQALNYKAITNETNGDVITNSTIISVYYN